MVLTFFEYGEYIKRRGVNRGVTLVEILISITLLGIVVSGAYATFALLGKGPTKVDSTQFQGINFARETLERLKESVSADPSISAPLKGGLTKIDALQECDFKNLYNGTRAYDVVDVDQNGDGTIDYKKVTVTVKWKD